MTLYSVRSKYYSNHEWWNCVIEIIIDNMGKVEKVEVISEERACLE